MPQTVLPYKLEKTKDTITPHSGLALVGEFAHGLRLPGKLDFRMPSPGSNAGYKPSEHVMPLILMFHGGGRSLEDLRQIRMDTGLRRILQMERMPSSDAVGDWLRRMGEDDGLDGLESVNRELLRVGLQDDDLREYTLDIDATQIVAEKRDAKRTYKGERGYMPIAGHLAENGMVVADEFRSGNTSPGSRNLEFIRHCTNQMPEGRRIAHLRSDSAAYQAKVFNWCDDQSITFAIGADLDCAVLDVIAAIPDDDWKPYKGSERDMIAETVHCMNRTRKAFRLIVLRRPCQQKLFEESDTSQRYTLIASNRDEMAEETIKWYNHRGETSENRIKELKNGFGMARMPCGEIEANAVFFRIGVLAYNLFVLFKMKVLPDDWACYQVRTVRWKLYQTAGKVVNHARETRLKIAEWMFNLFEEVRARCAKLAWVSAQAIR